MSAILADSLLISNVGTSRVARRAHGDGSTSRLELLCGSVLSGGKGALASAFKDHVVGEASEALQY
jgi:hypothetical protein